jgi:diacylglycerol kinase (ATP)
VARRIAVLVNPTSGKGRGRRAGATAANRLREHGLAVSELVGGDGGQAIALARRAVADGYDALVAVGGDGMLHLVLQAVAGTGTPLGLVPAGSGNDFARLLGLPVHDPLAAADVIAAGSVRVVDAAQVAGHWYAGVLSSGFDSCVNERANRMSWPRGRMRYNVAIVAELGVFRPRRFRIVLDDQPLEREAMLVAVGNGSSYGGGMRVCPAAVVDDGQLAVTVVGRLSMPAFLRVFPTVYKGTHVTHPAVSVHTARRVRLEAADAVAYADGEPVGPLPVDISCVPGALAVLAAAGPKTPGHVA